MNKDKMADRIARGFVPEADVVNDNYKKLTEAFDTLRMFAKAYDEFEASVHPYDDEMR